jgi:transposase
VETIGNWYWIVDEMEQAAMKPLLVQARRARLMYGTPNKSDKLDVRGLHQLKRCGTLPTVWIPPGDWRDKRELPRTRMVLPTERTRLKNRMGSVLDKYGLQGEVEGVSDKFGRQGRKLIERCLDLLPAQTRWTTERLLQQLDETQGQIEQIEKRMAEVFEETEAVRLLMTLPGVGFILAVVISQEIGEARRFGRAEQWAAYGGTTPRRHAGGDKTRHGKLRTDVNHYLKWAYAEARNLVAVNRQCKADRQVSKLYNRIRGRRGHSPAAGAVARHLAEASYWVLTKKESYKEPLVKEFHQQEPKRVHVMSR